MGFTTQVTHTIAAEWILKGAKPTAEELIKIAADIKDAGIPRDTVIEYEPPYSDMQTYPARMFIKPFEIRNN